MVDDPDAVAGGDLSRPFEQLHQPQTLAIQGDGDAALELDLHDLRLIGRELGTGDELEHVVLGRVLEILDPAALRRAPPQVVVDRVGRFRLGALGWVRLDRYPMLAGVGDLLLAAHLPGAHRRDRPQLGGQRRDRRLDPHLVVALAGAAVGDRVTPARARVLDGELGDQRAPERGEQRVAAAVQRVRLDRGRHILARELLARVHHMAVQRAQPQRLLANDLIVLAGLAQVDGQAHDLGVIGVLDPLEHHARIEAAGVQQQHALDLLGVGLVGGGPRGSAVQ